MDTGIEEAIQMLSEESQEEPSLLEIKNILIDIQIQLSTILKENIELRNEFEELKCSVNSNRKDLNSLTESANFNGKEIENLKGSLVRWLTAKFWRNLYRADKSTVAWL